MTFMKNKTGLIMLFLTVMLSGCGNNDDPYVDYPQSFADEQSHIEDGEIITSRITRISENMDDYYEKVNAESKLEINDILDSENEFLVSSKEDMEIIYIYLLSDTEYEKYIFSVNYLEQENINIHLQDNIAKMYVLCPEYTNVEVLTKSYSSATQECSLYVVDEVRNTDAVGGDLRYRIFSVDISARENIEFELCDALESEDYKIYGGFVIQFE